MSEPNPPHPRDPHPRSRVPDPASLITLPLRAARRATSAVADRRDKAPYSRVIGLLDLQLEDHILEIGCRTGIGVQQAAAIAALGKVCGIEQDGDLLAAAERRNHQAITDGYVELRQGSASRLPWPDAAFSKVFALDSPRDWPQPIVGLREARRVIRPGGALALVIHAPFRAPRDSVRDLGELWAHRLDEAGFTEVRYGVISAGRGSAAAITGMA